MLDIDNNISDNLYEIRVHGTSDFPFDAYKLQFNDYLNFISYHWHPEIEIVYVESGEIVYSVNEIEYNLKAGESMIVSSNQLHGCEKKGDSIWYALVFNPKIMYVDEESVIYENYFKRVNFKNLMLNHEQTVYVSNILNNFKDKEKNYQLRIVTNLFNLWTNIYDNNSFETTNVLSKASSRLKKALDFIHQNYNQKLKIEDLCDELCLCRSEVCKLFRDSMNTTFTEYLTKYRIQKSVALLSSNETNITEICDIVGFNSSSYFTEIFKKFYGQTPLNYRKAQLEKEHK